MGRTLARLCTDYLGVIALMSLRISVHTVGLSRCPLPRKLLSGSVRFVLEHEGVGAATVRIILADDATMQELNRRYLQHDYPTDVLTFVLETAPLEVEIYIGAEQAARQAAEYGVPVREEYVRLSIHGILHALGYDDQTPAQRHAMEARQEHYLRHYLGEHPAADTASGAASP